MIIQDFKQESEKEKFKNTIELNKQMDSTVGNKNALDK